MKEERIYIDTRLHWKTICEKYGVGRTVAYDAKKRGWLIGPKEKNIDICRNPEKFDNDQANAAARTIFWRKFARKLDDPSNWIEDCLQEAKLRMFELAGDKTFEADFNYFCKIAYYAILNYLQCQQLMGVMKNRVTDFSPLKHAEQMLYA